MGDKKKPDSQDVTTEIWVYFPYTSYQWLFVCLFVVTLVVILVVVVLMVVLVVIYGGIESRCRAYFVHHLLVNGRLREDGSPT